MYVLYIMHIVIYMLCMYMYVLSQVRFGSVVVAVAVFLFRLIKRSSVERLKKVGEMAKDDQR